mmetsp:Transcript_26636/g.58519  ORF Transcript_26636/g.58519 Transcript_26636/m.58519 type:complete len:253 (+) Transcript_26636:113-871(+)
MAQGCRSPITRLILTALVSCSSSRLLLRKHYKGAIIFLRPLGGLQRVYQHLNEADDGKFFETMEKAGVEVILPRAPFRVKLPSGVDAQAWWPLPGLPRLKMDKPEDTASAKESFDQVLAPILQRLETSYGLDKVIVGGFSMGAEFALQMLNFAPQIGGIFCMGGFLPDDSAVWKALKSGDKRPPVWMGHGTNDSMVPYDYGVATYQRLLSEGISAEFHTVQDLDHHMVNEEIGAIVSWSLHRLGLDDGETGD